MASCLLGGSQASIRITEVIQLAIDNVEHSVFHGRVRRRTDRVRRASDDPEPVELHSASAESVTRVDDGVRIVIRVHNAVV